MDSTLPLGGLLDGSGVVRAPSVSWEPRASVDLVGGLVDDDLESQPLRVDDLGLVTVGQRQLALVGMLLGERYDLRAMSGVETVGALDRLMRDRQEAGGPRPSSTDAVARGIGSTDLGNGLRDSMLWPMATLDPDAARRPSKPAGAGQLDSQLTDYERRGLDQRLSLADGHAYQGIDTVFPNDFLNLASLWEECERTSVPEMEHRFRDAFAKLAGSAGMAAIETFRICPTASNSIDIVAAVAAVKGLAVRLIEPTFDNLALILRRRGVDLSPLAETDLIAALEAGTVADLLAAEPCDALFLVQPNNPTGQTLDEASFRAIAAACASASKVLLLDFTFRFYNRRPFDHYAVLAETGVSFVAFEDTGKVWPTHDLKASLLFSSPDLAPIVRELYDEVFLCHSRFALSILEKCILETARFGLGDTIWRQVDDRREVLRDSISPTALKVSAEALRSDLPVEWLDCRGTGLDDEGVTEALMARGLHVLPGRHFYWSSHDQEDRRRNIRIALMKPLASFMEAMTLLRGFVGTNP